MDWQNKISEQIGQLTAKIEEIDKKLSNHLQHHFLLEIALIGSMVGLVGIILSLIK